MLSLSRSGREFMMILVVTLIAAMIVSGGAGGVGLLVRRA